MTNAETVMRKLNPNALIAPEDDHLVFIEDVLDPDRRMYRVEVQSSSDGRKAIAFCRHNPWGDNPFDYPTSHLSSAGQLCLGATAGGPVAQSNMDVQTAILKARYWCTAYSVLRETGVFPQPVEEGA